MRPSKRLRGLFAALLCAAAAVAAYPTKPVMLVVPYPAGGGSDGVARSYNGPLGAKLGQQVLVDNVGGVGGALGTQKVLNAPTDGHNVLFGSVNEVILAPLVNAAVKYKSEDLRLVVASGFAPLVVLTRKDLPVNSVDDLVALARKSSAEGKALSYGSVGIGSLYHLVTESLGQRIGAKLNHVPYKGGSPLIQDLAGGQVDFTIIAYQSSMDALATEGRMKILASLEPTRGGMLEQLPTVSESKELRNFAYTIWGGFFVRNGTPEDVVQKLRKAIVDTSKEPAVQAFRDSQSQMSAPDMSPQETTKFFEAETARYRALVKAIGLQPQ